MSNPSIKPLAWAAVITGSGLWGAVGLFIDPLVAIGFTTLDIAMIRMVAGFIIMLPLFAIRDKSVLKLQKLSHLWYFFWMGTVSLGFFQWFYLSAIYEMGMSLAVIMLYLSPGFVVIIARFTFGEPITPGKVFALLLMFFGCVLALELPAGLTANVPLSGLAFGLGAAFSFALYNIISKFALQTYSPVTVTIYTFLFTALALIPFASVYQTPEILLQRESWFWLSGIILFSTVAAYVIYLNGLRQVESGRATLASVFEVVVAVVLGVVIMGEAFNAMVAAGIILVLCSVLMISRPPRRV